MTEREHNGAMSFQAGSPARAEALGRASSSADSWGWRESGQEASEQGCGHSEKGVAEF